MIHQVAFFIFHSSMPKRPITGFLLTSAVILFIPIHIRYIVIYALYSLPHSFPYFRLNIDRVIEKGSSKYVQSIINSRA